MNLLTVEGISKSFGDKKVFENITFGIDEGDRTGLIGINGTGKSTLLKIVAGRETPDSGQVIRKNGLRVGYLPQTPEYDPDDTVLGQVFNCDNPTIQLIKEYEQAVREAELTGSPESQKNLYALNDRMDAANAWNLESDAKSILTKLNITDYYKKAGTLSGGQLKGGLGADQRIHVVHVIHIARLYISLAAWRRTAYTNSGQPDCYEIFHVHIFKY